MTLLQPRRTHRPHSEAFKQPLIEACGEHGASVAGVALANGINANQLRRWMRERDIEPPELSCLPLRPAASEAIGGFIPVQLAQSSNAPIRLELRKGAAVVTVDWLASSAAVSPQRSPLDSLRLNPASTDGVTTPRSDSAAESAGG